MTHESKTALATNTEYLALKWGTLKRWDLKTDASLAALDKYFEAGRVSMSRAMQKDTAEQKAAICELIDCLDSEQVYLDWDEKYVSKEEAKEYVLNYGKTSTPSTPQA